VAVPHYETQNYFESRITPDAPVDAAPLPTALPAHLSETGL